jgi:membrane protein implicated in regulation of membrane protease activity
MEYMTFFWLGVIVVALVAEALTAGLVSIWLVPGALVSMILSLFKLPLGLQIPVFFVLSGGFIVLAKTVFRRFFQPKPSTKTNVDALIGAHAVVTERVDNLSGCGQVRVNSQIWSARSIDPDIVFEVGDVVSVMAIEGVKLICK